MVIRLYCIHQSCKKRSAPTRDLPSGHSLQEAIDVSDIDMDEVDPFLLHTWHFLFVKTPQNGAVGIIGFTPKCLTYDYEIRLSIHT
jgi:hypothetical protein